MKRQAGDNLAADRAAFAAAPVMKSRRPAVVLLSRASRRDLQFMEGQGDLLPDLWVVSEAVGPSLYKGPPRRPPTPGPEVVVISDDDGDDEHDHAGAE